MLKEALSYLIDIGEEREAQRVNSETDRKSKYLLPNGKVVEIEHDSPRRSIALSLDTLAPFDVEGAEVWYSADGVTLVQNPRLYGDNAVHMELKPTAAFEFLCCGNWMDQKAFIRSIRSHCRREMEAASPGLIGSLESLRFAVQSVTEGTVKNTKESLGKSIESEVTGAGQLPESISIRMQRWNQFVFEQEVELFLDVDMANCKLRWSPVKSSLLEAEDRWMLDLSGAVEEVCPDSTKCHGHFRGYR